MLGGWCSRVLASAGVPPWAEYRPVKAVEECSQEAARLAAVRNTPTRTLPGRAVVEEHTVITVR